jgi:Holliday junction resolvasome RuvABC endonuclease subunit
MNVLALDLATKTGWAMSVEKRVISGTVEFPVNRGESPGMRFIRLRAWLRMHFGPIDLIVYEQAHHRGGAATMVGVGMATHLMSFAAEHYIELMAVHTGTLKKWATGKGNASKEEMIKAAQDRGHMPKDDNEADALLMLAYAREKVGDSREIKTDIFN